MIIKKLIQLTLFTVTLQVNAMENGKLPTDFYRDVLHDFAQELGCLDDASKKDDLVRAVHKIQANTDSISFSLYAYNDTSSTEDQQTIFLSLYAGFVRSLVHSSIHKLHSLYVESEGLNPWELNWHLVPVSQDEFCRRTGPQNDIEAIQRFTAVKLAEQKAHTALLNILEPINR